MKTTILFKCPGAWSPLWNLSKEKSFKIKSLNCESQMFVGFDIGGNSMVDYLQSYQEAFLDMMTKYHQTHLMEQQFNAEKRQTQIVRRADEIFGIWNPMDKREFCACLDGSEGLLVLARQTDDGFSIELRKANP